jgi:hypothetical protein
MVTFTLHDHLRRLAGSHQKRIYDILFRTSAAALQKLAADPRFIGGQIGMTGVLQTWTRDLSVLHPHIHYIVPAGGLDEQGNQWRPAKKTYLMPKRALSKIFRAKFRDALKKTAPDLFDAIPAETWTQKWVVHLKAVGAGEKALTYLAPYLFQGPISNKRLVKLENGLVTFRYKASKTRKWKTRTIPVEPFIAGFLQHVLPPRFVRVRSYGLLHPNKRALFLRARALLEANHIAGQTPEPSGETPRGVSDEPEAEEPKTIPCPQCGTSMRWIKHLDPNRISLLHRIRAP